MLGGAILVLTLACAQIGGACQIAGRYCCLFAGLNELDCNAPQMPTAPDGSISGNVLADLTSVTVLKLYNDCNTTLSANITKYMPRLLYVIWNRRCLTALSCLNKPTGLTAKILGRVVCDGGSTSGVNNSNTSIAAMSTTRSGTRVTTVRGTSSSTGAPTPPTPSSTATSPTTTVATTTPSTHGPSTTTTAKPLTTTGTSTTTTTTPYPATSTRPRSTKTTGYISTTASSASPTSPTTTTTTTATTTTIPATTTWTSTSTVASSTSTSTTTAVRTSTHSPDSTRALASTPSSSPRGAKSTSKSTPEATTQQPRKTTRKRTRTTVTKPVETTMRPKPVQSTIATTTATTTKRSNPKPPRTTTAKSASGKDADVKTIKPQSALQRRAGVNVGTIVGGSVGGLLVLVISVLLVTVLCIRMRKRAANAATRRRRSLLSHSLDVDPETLIELNTLYYRRNGRLAFRVADAIDGSMHTLYAEDGVVVNAARARAPTSDSHIYESMSSAPPNSEPGPSTSAGVLYRANSLPNLNIYDDIVHVPLTVPASVIRLDELREYGMYARACRDSNVIHFAHRLNSDMYILSRSQ